LKELRPLVILRAICCYKPRQFSFSQVSICRWVLSSRYQIY